MKTIPLTLAAVLLLAACQQPAAEQTAETPDATASYDAAQKAYAAANNKMHAGKDPEVRALAQKVIAAQEAEMKEMQAWLDKKGMQVEKPMTAADHAAMGH
ncbi:DUF305 domain-containing protein [Sphingorhabdus sp.]|uniref:DUF305 domain-containing protein n=1 Tax=Sphingorhabdus sp. TaxID=1902408 RepID=UPI0037C813EA